MAFLFIQQKHYVSQLSDVQPTDWAFQSLQSLIERYGCIAGYPNSTFGGNRAATRYELAAALNACLDRLSDKFATKEDLATVKALQDNIALVTSVYAILNANNFGSNPTIFISNLQM